MDFSFSQTGMCVQWISLEAFTISWQYVAYFTSIDSHFEFDQTAPTILSLKSRVEFQITHSIRCHLTVVCISASNSGCCLEVEKWHMNSCIQQVKQQKNKQVERNCLYSRRLCLSQLCVWISYGRSSESAGFNLLHNKWDKLNLSGLFESL